MRLYLPRKTAGEIQCATKHLCGSSAKLKCPLEGLLEQGTMGTLQTSGTRLVYSANITTGALLLSESRALALLLLDGADKRELTQRALEDNLLQKRSPVTTKKMVTLIKSRFLYLTREDLEVVAHGDRAEASLLLLAAIVQAHKVVGDFCRYIGKECIGLYKTSVTSADWDAYYDQCCALQPSVASWSDKTAQKVRAVVFRILVECALLQADTLAILPLFVPQCVQAYLAKPEHAYARTCLEAFNE